MAKKIPTLHMANNLPSSKTMRFLKIFMVFQISLWTFGFIELMICCFQEFQHFTWSPAYSGMRNFKVIRFCMNSRFRITRVSGGISCYFLQCFLLVTPTSFCGDWLLPITTKFGMKELLTGPLDSSNFQGDVLLRYTGREGALTVEYLLYL